MDIRHFISFVLVMLAFGLYGLLHSILASQRFKSWLEGIAGAGWMKRWYRLLFNILGVLTLLPIFFLMAVMPNSGLYRIPYPWRWLTYALQAYGLWVVAASLRQTGVLDFLGLRQIDEKDAPAPNFTSAGYYKRVRHPLYSGAILIFLASARMSVLSLAFNLSMSLYFWIGAIFEERKLVATFGEEYTNYAAETPMFVPKFSR